MKRALGNFERAATITSENAPFNFVGILCLEGHLQPETLEQALRSLQQRHPLLTARVVIENKNYTFETEGGPDVPFNLVERSREDQWITIAEDYLNQGSNLHTGPLAQCTYVYEPQSQQAEILLCMDHVIVDGASGVNLLHELLAHCANLIQGSEIPAQETRSLLPAAEDHFPAELHGLRRGWMTLRYFLSQMGDELSYNMRMIGKPRPPIHATYRAKILPMQLTPEITQSLVRCARQENVTVNSALLAAMLLALRKHCYSGVSLPMRYFSWANLRPYLQPPAPAEDMGCCIAPLRFTVPMPAERGFWDLARQVNDQIYQAGKGEDKFIASLMAKNLMRMIFRLNAFRMGNVALSYTGAVPLQETYGPLQIQGVHGFISNFSLGPEYTAQATLWKDALWWDILYLDSDMDTATAETIAEEIQSMLMHACETM